MVLTKSKVDETPIEGELPSGFGSQTAKDPKTKTLIILDCASDELWSFYVAENSKLTEYIPASEDLLYGLELGCENISREDSAVIVSQVGDGKWGNRPTNGIGEA